jgi:F-type H+-transporting ATPase subunit b
MREETQGLKQKLEKEAKLQAEALLKQAEHDASKKVEQAEKQIAFEVAQAQEEIKQSIKSVAFSAARKIVSKEIDEETHQHLIDEAINEGLKHES